MEGYKKCPYCGEEIPESATKCMYCTAWLNEPQATAQSQPVSAQPQLVQVKEQSQPIRRKNGIGTVGLVLSIIGLILCCVPSTVMLKLLESIIIWFPGILFSFIGIFKRPKGVAIAGLVISFVSIWVTLVMLFIN